MSYVYMTIIVPDAQVAQARELCEQLAGPPGAGMFSAPLSADGQAPATHWCSSGAIGEEFSTLLSSPQAMYKACQSHNLPASLEQCEQILEESEIVDLNEEGVFDTLSRMKLQII